MSVQRAEVHWARYLDGNRRVVLEADHARIVAEAGAAVFAFHPEWTVTGMCDPDCLACRRLTELITERSAGYEEGKADAEQAHAAALIGQYEAGLKDGRKAHWGKPAAAPRTLTADDPEPAVGSVGLDGNGRAWQRTYVHAWCTYGVGGWTEWESMLRLFAPFTLIHDGGAA